MDDTPSIHVMHISTIKLAPPSEAGFSLKAERYKVKLGKSHVYLKANTSINLEGDVPLDDDVAIPHQGRSSSVPSKSQEVSSL